MQRAPLDSRVHRLIAPLAALAALVTGGCGSPDGANTDAGGSSEDLVVVPAADLSTGPAVDLRPPVDLAPPADLAPSPDLLAPPDLVPPLDLTTPPDLLPPPVVNPHYSVGGTVNAAVHAGNSWYVGGSFNRISPYAAANLIPLDATGTPTKCAIDTGFDGAVTAIVYANNALYVGGVFTKYKGVSANRIARIDAATCALDQAFSPANNNGFDGVVLAMDTAGGALYVGGQFLNYRGASAQRVAKLDLVTGDLDTTFSPANNNGFDNNVLALVVAGSSLYLGGTFNTYRGVASSAAKLAKLDLKTGAQDTVFSPPGVGTNGFNDTVASLAASNTALYVGGYFTAYRGVAGSATRLARLDLVTGALDTNFSPPGANKNGFNDVVFTMIVSGNALYAGGRFTTYRGAASPSLIARLDATTGALDAGFSNGNAGFSGQFTIQVTALALSGNSLFAGGTFSGYRGAPTSAYCLAKLDATTGVQDASFLPVGSTANGVSGGVGGTTIISLLMQGNTLWAGGRFTVYGGHQVNNLARLDDTSFAVDTTFSPPASNGFDAAVSALAVSGSSLYAGGSFTAWRGITNSARRLAKLDLTTGDIDAVFSPVGAASNGFDNAVNALAVSGKSLYAGGKFSAYRGVASSANALAKLDLTSGALDAAFSPPGAMANGFDSTVNALAVSANALYAGGAFTAYQGVATSANRLAKLDLTSGALDAVFGPKGANGFDAAVNALTVSGGALYVGGAFTAYLGKADSARRLAKLDLTTGAIDTVFSPTANATANGFDDVVSALTVAGGALYAGGSFNAYRGVADTAHRLARLDPTSGALDGVFSPVGATANGTDGPVTALGVSGTTLLVGGSFSQYRGGLPMYRSFLLLDPTTGVSK